MSEQVVWRFPFVIVRMGKDGAETPLATIYAETEGDANQWAYHLYGPDAFAYSQAASPEQYEDARCREFVATHKSRVLEESAKRNEPQRTEETMQAIKAAEPRRSLPKWLRWLHGQP